MTMKKCDCGQMIRIPGEFQCQDCGGYRRPRAGIERGLAPPWRIQQLARRAAAERPLFDERDGERDLR
jgi:hypothetical protein